jgi:hypothetical protein
VVIHDFDIARSWCAVRPLKAYPPLIVDADAELAAAVAFQGFEPVTRKATQSVQMGCRFKPIEALFRLATEALEGPPRIRAFACLGNLQS